MYVTPLVLFSRSAAAVLFHSVCFMILQVRAASDMYITGCYDDQGDGDDGDGDSDVICLDKEDAAESELRKLAMSPRVPAKKGDAPAKKKDSEEEEEVKPGDDDENEDEHSEESS